MDAHETFEGAETETRPEMSKTEAETRPETFTYSSPIRDTATFDLRDESPRPPWKCILLSAFDIFTVLL